MRRADGGRVIACRVASRAATSRLSVAWPLTHRRAAPVPMLRAGLIGYPSTGKTTLFRLMTSAREGAAQASTAKTEANVGISRVPDDAPRPAHRDVQPAEARPGHRRVRRHGRRGPAAARRTSLDVAPFRNADALVHVLRAFRDEAVPHPSGGIDPARDAQAMDDELILADLGIVERRLERLEKDLKKSRDARPEARAGGPGCRARTRSRTARPLRDARPRRRRLEAPARLPVPLGQAAAARAERRRGRPRQAGHGRSQQRGPRAVPRAAATRAVPLCAKIELEIAELDPQDAAAFIADLGLAGVGPRPRDPRQLRPARLHVVLHGRRGRVPRVVDPARHHRAGGRRRDPLRHRARASSAPRSSPTTHLVARGTMAACKDHGEFRLEGKEYVVRDGDIINFRLRDLATAQTPGAGPRRPLAPPGRGHVSASSGPSSCARRRSRSSRAAPSTTCASWCTQLRAHGYRDGAGERPVQVVPEGRDPRRTPRPGGCST